MALFELIDTTGAATSLGPWQAPAGGADALAFSTLSTPEPIWRADLPGDPLAALEAMTRAEAVLRRQEAAVDAAPARLRALAAVGDGASFSTVALPEPERQLLADLDALRGGVGAPVDGVAFGLRDDAAAAWAATEERLRAFTTRAHAAVTAFAVVETLVEGALVARTRVSWTGDMRSLFGGLAPARHGALHQRTLGLALRSRAGLLKTFGTVMRGAAIVTMIASSPAGAALALPAAWRFVEQVLGDLRSM